MTTQDGRTVYTPRPAMGQLHLAISLMAVRYASAHAGWAIATDPAERTTKRRLADWRLVALCRLIDALNRKAQQ